MPRDSGVPRLDPADNAELRRIASSIASLAAKRCAAGATYEEKRRASVSVMADAMWHDEEAMLQGLVTTTERIGVDGETYRALKQSSTTTYHGLWGTHVVDEPLYRKESVRRAADCAAHLVDEVLPRAPVRQWVLTFPRHVRFALARDSRLATKVIAIWLRALEGFHRRRARCAGYPLTRTGAVTFVQRFGSALNLNVHLHTVVPDGTFAIEDRPSFVSLSPPTTEEIEALLPRVVSRVRRCVARRSDANDDAPLDTLDEMRAASAAERSSGAFVGRTGLYEAFFEGFSLHSGCASTRTIAKASSACAATAPAARSRSASSLAMVTTRTATA